MLTWLQARQALYHLYVATMNCLPPRAAIMLTHRLRLGTWPNIRHPQTFNEKIQFRKLYGDHPTYARLADKILVKDYVRQVIGGEFVIPTLWYGQRLPAPEKRRWPLPFVIKASNNSGKIIFVRDAFGQDWNWIDLECEEWMRARRSGYPFERWYEHIQNNLLVEPMIASNPNDYKFYVFDGKVHFVQVDTDRFAAHKRCFFDPEWNRLPLALKFPLEDREIRRPVHLAKMLEIAETLASGFDFVRIDLYDLEGGPKFGEMTFAPESGHGLFEPPEYDRVFGDRWQINQHSDLAA